MKKNTFLVLLLINSMYVLAQYAGADTEPVDKKPVPGGPIDTNTIILIIAAAVLILGVIGYKKLSLKKA